MPDPLTSIGGDVLAGIIGDLFGGKDKSAEYQAQATKRYNEARVLLRQQKANYVASQRAAGQAALAQQQLVEQELKNPVPLFGGDVVNTIGVAR